MNTIRLTIFIECLFLSMANDALAALPNGEFFSAGPFKVYVQVDPETPRVGKNQIQLWLQDEAGAPVGDAQLSVVAIMPSMGSMPAMYAPAEMTEDEAGHYQGEFSPSMSGEWPLTIDISTAAGAGSITFDLATGRKGIRCATCSGLTDNIPGTVQVNPARQQLIGITTGRVRLKNLRISIRAAGIVTYDETTLRDVALKFAGWIGKLYANSVGSPVVKGEPLFTVYSPELLTAQQEFLETLRYATNPQSRSRVAAAHRRLRLWDVTESQIAQLKASGQAQDYIPMMANHSGIVIAKEIHAGSAFHKGERLMRTADISRLWVEAQVYDYELPLIQPGMKAIIASPNIQNNEYVGTVDYIYPFMQGDTHTARVRIILDNADGLFLPDMYVQVRLRAKLGKRLVVPESAVLYSGTNRIVFLALGDGRFAPRKIKTGQRNRQWIEVLDGLLENDTVVTSGNFLISAESKLKAGLDQW